MPLIDFARGRDCSDCAYFHWVDDPNDQERGHCRLYPPTVIGVSDGSDGTWPSDGAWPHVYHGDWCGQFRFRADMLDGQGTPADRLPPGDPLLTQVEAIRRHLPEGATIRGTVEPPTPNWTELSKDPEACVRALDAVAAAVAPEFVRALKRTAVRRSD